MNKVLVVDDEKSFTELLEIALRREGYTVTTATSGTEALQLLNSTPFDLVICDILMPDISGVQILKECKKAYPDISFILITAYASAETAIDALQGGALTYITKPPDMEELKHIVRRALEKKNAKQETDQKGLGRNKLIGKSPKMVEICQLIFTVAPTDSTVLITGESGTGKELIARAMHEGSRRKRKEDDRFVSINCGAFPEQLLESELFGYVRGAFTGANTNKMGLFEVANGGTIFLDEIGEMSPSMQVKLLRVLQDRKVRRVGGTEEIPVDVRIIAATNLDLKQAAKEKRFREDLYYRLAVITIDLPPLRKRIEDLEPLVEYFLQKYSQRVNKAIAQVSKEAFLCLERYLWPGNVRELENVIERAVTLEPTNEIQLERLPDYITDQQAKPQNHHEPIVLPEHGIDLERFIEQAERELITQALERTHGRQAEAAKLLKLSYRSFRHKLDKIKRNDF